MTTSPRPLPDGPRRLPDGQGPLPDGPRAVTNGPRAVPNSARAVTNSPGPLPECAPPIRVLVVEDDPLAADAHALYVERVPGFTVAGVVHSRGDASQFLKRTPVDLLLLDLYLPDGHGLQLVRSLRTAGHTADVIAVTSARDLAIVREGVSLGVVQYVLKPFTFATLRDRLGRYAEFRAAAGEASGQEEVDRALAVLRAPQPVALPKGLAVDTLQAVTRTLRSAGPDGLSSGAAATAVGISRITARRYLEYLVDTGRAGRAPQYGQIGRPELLYRWAGRR
ncbi:response regulator [Streptomyces sp. NPDC053048]|uniref:response regulator n=1 Tax=Streptomyces sp. NPDC053048 TaxID=3365694 RepID=UPI0037D28601